MNWAFAPEQERSIRYQVRARYVVDVPGYGVAGIGNVAGRFMLLAPMYGKPHFDTPADRSKS